MAKRCTLQVSEHFLQWPPSLIPPSFRAVSSRAGPGLSIGRHPPQKGTNASAMLVNASCESREGTSIPHPTSAKRTGLHPKSRILFLPDNKNEDGKNDEPNAFLRLSKVSTKLYFFPCFFLLLFLFDAVCISLIHMSTSKWGVSCLT